MHKKWFYLFTGLVLLLPLVVVKYSMNPFIFYKAVFLQVFSVTLLISYLYYIFYADSNLHKVKWTTKVTPLLIVLLLFYISIFVSSLLGYDWSRSLWSRAERMTGLFVLLHYFILYIVWRDVFDWQELKNIWKYFVGVVGSIVIFIGLIQIFDPLFLSNLGSARVGSTLGNAIYVAGFCSFVFFSSLYFFITTKNKYKFFWLAEIIFSIIVLFATQTRGDMIGLFIGFLLFVSLYLWLSFKDISKVNKKLGVTTLALIVILPILLFVFKDSKVVSSVPVFNRFFSQSLSQSTGGTRLVMWKTAFISWQQKPWFGWGWDNFYYAANQNYLPEFLKFGHGEEWTDNAHNVLFNTLATVGIVGLLSYLAIFVVLIYMGIRLLKFYRNDKNLFILFLVLLSFLVSHFIRNFFVFEDLSSYLYLFFIFVIFDILYINYKKEGASIINKKEKNNVILNKIKKIAKNFIFIVVCLVSVFSLYRFAYIPAKASYWQTKAIYTALVDFDKSLDIHRKAVAIDYNMYRDDISYNYADFILAWMHGHPDFATSKYKTLSEKMHYIGVSALYSYLLDYPDDARVYYVLGNTFMDAYDFWMNRGYVEKAEETYAKGLEYSPKRQSLIFGLIRAKVALGKYNEALELAKSTVADDDSIGESHWILSFVYNNMGENEKAVEEINKAYELNYNFEDNRELTLAFRTLISYGDPKVMAEFVKNRILSMNASNKYLLQSYIDYLKSTEEKDNLSQFEAML
ncbi:MAG: hypothetical protein COX80_01240 [Candidatus Magasanikbacteria bacterium CG_4_10_14_0_2_um_filter_33_14]|uniref:O-antigen ligase-related domain-containing protein n=1 Tax=Candidatus Magasanikbacteria bacterium CG_4_10_14_0_2_um_filter_33_14 TaxID=1974636 RepID=A0A2M7VBK1_9BACT|nr:MAG: hypothetical protein COX80_01240 [Candidatus Magasanikbacteria bacterium CG_4_10_14_0_2_um_filter_33_14]